MFKNALLYHIDPSQAPALAELEARLAGAPFIECGATQTESAGWVPPRGDRHAALAEQVGGQLILALCTETKAVPGSAVKTALESRLDRLEAETGRRPKGRQTKALKEEIVHDLLPRAFPKRATTAVWIDARAGRMLVAAASLKRADGVVTRLVDLLGGGIAPRLLQTALSPATAMAGWLQEQQAPAGFSIDRDCELKLPEGEKATVRYARHTLELAEIGEHIRQGKRPTQLALTWRGRVSFVLTETGALRRIQWLDGLLEGAGAAAGRAEDGFDADVAIATGALRQMIPDLIEALGGVQAEGAATPAAAAPSPAGNVADLPPWNLAAA